MSGECPAARALAQQMAVAYLDGVGAEPDGDAFGPLVQMFLAPAEIVTGALVLVREISARLDAQAGVLADLAVRAAERDRDLDWMDVLLADERVRREFVPGDEERRQADG